ncbi:MAG: hypothetical protein MUF24_08835 [Chitinophagaceae bacterium]|nr:hypothetical protein [Chitinophagaceae bacterium]
MPQAIGKYRWTICALLFFATTVNYLDRQVLSLLQPVLAERFNWTNSDYANITAVFQFGYAISMLFAGRYVKCRVSSYATGVSVRLSECVSDFHVVGPDQTVTTGPSISIYSG